MRIVGGRYKSIRFKPPKGFKSRPTTDFAKEGLFNVLTHRLDLEEMEVLDLFCGTGNISFEFLSRGATVTSIDNNFKCLKYIKETAQKLDALNQISLLRLDVKRYLEDTTSKFDIVFMDPPFDIKHYEELIGLVFAKKLLKKEGILIVEHHKKIDLTGIQNFEQLKKYGNVCFSFFS
jgi:16S rRNA (guanine(966)-N(2))-methyltransferase RsmD